SSSAAYPWQYGAAGTPTFWIQYNLTLFGDSSQGCQVDPEHCRELPDLFDNYLPLGLDPSFSAHGKTGDNSAIWGFVNWVFMRPLADPEPSPLAGDPENLVVDIGIHNYETLDSERWIFEGRVQWIFYINVTSPVDIGSDISAGIGFYDFANNFYSFYYDNDTRVVTLVSPHDGVSASISNVTTGDTWLYCIQKVGVPAAPYCHGYAAELECRATPVASQSV
ncbi:unnamed protein product, partial [marine sediment metagenome]